MLALKIQQRYIKYLLEEKKMPNSIQEFTSNIGLDEKGFYEHFSDFSELESCIWDDFFTQTHERLLEENIYYDYSAREKILAFYFTLVEVLKENREFLMISSARKGFVRYVIAKFKAKFTMYIKNLIEEGIARREIQKRMFLSSQYPAMFWQETDYIIKFWLKDQSEGFEKTDAAIEKAINLTFDLIGYNLADSSVDFVKFVFQNRK
jgi:hypothetical protein